MDFGNALVAILTIVVLARIAHDPRIPATWRFVAHDLESDIYQDAVTGEFFAF